MTAACGREECYFLHSGCPFLFSRSSSWPFVNRNCLLVESMNKVLAWDLKIPVAISWVGEVISSCLGVCVCMRDENEQKNVQ